MDYHLSNTAVVLLVIALVWDMIWRGFALWRSSRNNDMPWFIALLIINSVGILPIFYLTFIGDREGKAKD